MSLRFLVRRSRKHLYLALLVLVFAGAGLFFLLGKIAGYFLVDREIAIKEDPARIKVLLHDTQTVVEMGLEEYLMGVVAAEMPASFELEALKAQAVAARTYAVKRLLVPDPRVKKIKPDADISTDHTINQAWISTAEMRKRWGKWNYAAHRKKIKEAIEGTKGQVLVYQGQIIDPVYHASCGGQGTENSGEVWKVDLPYLRRVACTGHQDRHAAEQRSYSIREIDALLGTSLNALPASNLAKNAGILAVKQKSRSGRVLEVSVAGKTFSGAELRAKLELPSTRFSWQLKEGKLHIQTNGYGHGVGMCQYGANDLAGQGKNYDEILKHYYTGVEIAAIKTGKNWAD